MMYFLKYYCGCILGGLSIARPKTASSSSCECGDNWCYNSNTKHCNNRHQCDWKNPFYPTFKQPLVYYAQVPLTWKQKSRSNIKKNQNCFVKAFRWYTEEHPEDSGNEYSKKNPDLVRFATWLDTKYEQFMQENQMEPTAYNLSLKSTSEKIQKHGVGRHDIIKKFTRLRSPWRKRKSNKEAGDVRQKSDQSFKYILKPKDFVHSASERIQVSEIPSNRSYPVVSIEYQQSRKLIVKSQSLTNCCERSIKVNDLLIVTQEETVKERGLCNENDNMYQKDLKSKVSSKSLTTDFTNNVSCQCSKLFQKTDIQTQYEDLEKIRMMYVKEVSHPTRPAFDGHLPSSKKCCNVETQTENFGEKFKVGPIKKIVQEPDLKHNISYQCYEETLNIDSQEVGHTKGFFYVNQKIDQLSTDFPLKINNEHEKTDSLFLNGFTSTAKTTNSFNILVNDTVQTSDCSIILGKDIGRDYPLFMRVVYADKLDRNILKLT